MGGLLHGTFAFGHRIGDGFVDKHMFAGRKSSFNLSGMQVIWGHKRHSFNLWIGQKGLVRAMRRASMHGGTGGVGLWIDIVTGNERKIRGLVDRCQDSVSVIGHANERNLNSFGHERRDKNV